ncbi:MAG: efflux RND transporter periplasmic adaptor subunit [Hyphomicrobiaceae bacterium]|nr:efflux RND transporter periplasmic adaptor subunit [Hyphomicrobiaceae bacterium]
MARRSRLLIYGLPLAALIAAGGASLSIGRSQPQAVALAPVVSPPVQPGVPATAGGGVRGFIGAAGLIEPNGQEIDMGSHVSGIVADVRAVPGQKVRTGDPLFVIDERTARGNLELRRAELLAAERRRDQTLARAATLQAQIEAARAAASAARAEMEEWQDQVRTADELMARGGNAISQREVTRRRNAQRSAQGRLEEAQARTAEIEAELRLIARPNGASLAVDEAAVAQARRAVERAEIDLALLTVRAPADGTVLQVNVRPGEFAFAGTLVTPLVVLGNLDPLHVRVDIDEADVPRFEPSARAYASLRGKASERMQLSFVRIEPLIVPKRSLTGASGERVDTRVLRVIYALPPGTADAYPGQQADVFIESAAPGRPQLSQSGAGMGGAEQVPPRP